MPRPPLLGGKGSRGGESPGRQRQLSLGEIGRERCATASAGTSFAIFLGGGFTFARFSGDGSAGLGWRREREGDGFVGVA